MGGIRMNKRLTMIVTVVLLSVVLVLTGCGNESKSGDGEKKVLKVATDATYAPMEYMDEKGNIVGLDIDIVKEIAKAAGFEVEFINYGWEPLFVAVKNGEVDFAVSSITITEQRKAEGYDFSEPYFYANQQILVPEGSNITGVKDLEGKKISVQIATTGHIIMQEMFGETSPNILAYDSMPLAITAMLNGDADAAVGDNSVISGYIKNNPNVKVKVINDDSFEREYYGLMVKSGNKEVLDLLNEGIKKIKENGKLKEITGQDVDND